MNLLENNKDFHDKEAYQKVAFYRGVELYNEGNYQEAITYLDKSLKEPQNAAFTARATYWKAECDYQLGNFEKSLTAYNSFQQLSGAKNTSEFQNLKYNLAYSQFKLKNYTEAINNFKSYVGSSNANPTRKKDAYMRLGDSYFVTSQYWPAMENYNLAIEMGGNDYAEFQKAISYGFVDRTEKKIEELVVFIKNYPKSVYYDDALYELGNTYVAQNKSNEGIAAYDKLVREIPNSSFVPKALLKMWRLAILSLMMLLIWPRNNLIWKTDNLKQKLDLKII